MKTNLYHRPLGMFNVLSKCGLLSLLFFVSAAVNAQDDSTQSDDPKEWGFIVEPYIMFPNMSGEVGIGDIARVDIDASTGDIFGVLDFGAMLYLEARNDQWAVTSDFVYMSLESVLEPGVIVQNGATSLDQTIWEVAGLYRVARIVEVGAGFRLNYIDMTLAGQRFAGIGETAPFALTQSATMFDPVFISRVMNDFADRWNYNFRADVGGFGVGSDLTFQLQGYVGYSFSKLFMLSAGYRYLYIDYDEGSGSDRLVFDVGEYGWVLKFAFRF